MSALLSIVLQPVLYALTSSAGMSEPVHMSGHGAAQYLTGLLTVMLPAAHEDQQQLLGQLCSP